MEITKNILNSRYKEASDAAIELLEAFPILEDDLMELLSAFILKEITAREFDRGIRDLCINEIKTIASKIKRSLKADRRVLNAYYDIARYQTDFVDASIEWECDRQMLQFLLKKRKPPLTPEERQQLPVPQEVVNLREIN